MRHAFAGRSSRHAEWIKLATNHVPKDVELRARDGEACQERAAGPFPCRARARLFGKPLRYTQRVVVSHAELLHESWESCEPSLPAVASARHCEPLPRCQSSGPSGQMVVQLPSRARDIVERSQHPS